MTAAGYLPYLALTIALEAPLAVALAPSGLRRRVALDDVLLNVLSQNVKDYEGAFGEIRLEPQAQAAGGSIIQ